MISDFSIFAIFGSKKLKKWNHAAWFYPKSQTQEMTEIANYSLIPRVFTNTPF